MLDNEIYQVLHGLFYDLVTPGRRLNQQLYTSALIQAGLAENSRRLLERSHAHLERSVEHAERTAAEARRATRRSIWLAGAALFVAVLSSVATLVFSVLNYEGDQGWQDEQTQILTEIRDRRPPR
jgi:ABC-type Fe3+ transport system permease subunit